MAILRPISSRVMCLVVRSSCSRASWSRLFAISLASLSVSSTLKLSPAWGAPFSPRIRTDLDLPVDHLGNPSEGLHCFGNLEAPPTDLGATLGSMSVGYKANASAETISRPISGVNSEPERKFEGARITDSELCFSSPTTRSKARRRCCDFDGAAGIQFLNLWCPIYVVEYFVLLNL